MHKTLLLTLCLLVNMFHVTTAAANRSNEKLFYLGVLNGQIQDNSMVKVSRTLSDAILYRNEFTDNIPDNLIIRRATIRDGKNQTANITVKQTLTEKEAFVTVNVAMYSNGKKTQINYSMQGEDVVLKVPEDTKNLELRSDDPLELLIPAGYRGNIRILMDIEDDYIVMK